MVIEVETRGVSGFFYSVAGMARWKDHGDGRHLGWTSGLAIRVDRRLSLGGLGLTDRRIPIGGFSPVLVRRACLVR